MGFPNVSLSSSKALPMGILSVIGSSSWRNTSLRNAGANSSIAGRRYEQMINL
jgi:hypothetical protein